MSWQGNEPHRNDPTNPAGGADQAGGPTGYERPGNEPDHSSGPAYGGPHHTGSPYDTSTSARGSGTTGYGEPPYGAGGIHEGGTVHYGQTSPGGEHGQPGGGQQYPGGAPQYPGGAHQYPGGGQPYPGGGQPYPGSYPQYPGGNQPYQEGAQPQGMGPPYGQPPPKTNTLATIGLVAAVISVVIPIAAPIGAVLGHIARGQIRHTGEQGMGIAKAAIWVGWIFTALWILICGGLILLTINSSNVSPTDTGG